MSNEKLALSVEGMTCNHCKMSVEKAVQTLPGVISAEVDLAAKQVMVEFDSQQVQRDQLVEAIVTAGYEVL